MLFLFSEVCCIVGMQIPCNLKQHCSFAVSYICRSFGRSALLWHLSWEPSCDSLSSPKSAVICHRLKLRSAEWYIVWASPDDWSAVSSVLPCDSEEGCFSVFAGAGNSGLRRDIARNYLWDTVAWTTYQRVTQERMSSRMKWSANKMLLDLDVPSLWQRSWGACEHLISASAADGEMS